VGLGLMAGLVLYKGPNQPGRGMDRRGHRRS
jgi:hypothetical protein